MQYQYIVLGGTFDILHKGHLKLIHKAFSVSSFVTIGLTSDRFNKKRSKFTLNLQNTRKKILENFLSRKCPKRFRIVLIDDIFGTTLVDSEISAVITTKETIGNVRKINRIRERNKLKKLDLITVPHSLDSSGKIVSSTRIRGGEISPEGEIYMDLLLKLADRNRSLDQNILNQFKRPLGKIVQSIQRRPLITVGDITTKTAFEKGISPKISVIDLKTQRNSLNDSNHLKEFNGYLIREVWSDPGIISKELVQEIHKALKRNKKTLIIVNGEEDLATIPVILLSPFGTRVYYGQPGEGMVEVIVNQEIKYKICRFLRI